MPVTEIALLSSTPLAFTEASGREAKPSLSPEFLSLLRNALRIQDTWCERTPSASRGAAFYVSHPLPGSSSSSSADVAAAAEPPVILCTAHWNSAAHHHEWIASADNQTAFSALFPYVDAGAVEFFHVRDAELFRHLAAAAAGDDDNDNDGAILVRILVSSLSRPAFEAKLSPLLDSSAGADGGWRIEKPSAPAAAASADEEDVDEFVIVRPWVAAQESASDVIASAVFREPELAPLILRCDARSFKRII